MSDTEFCDEHRLEHDSDDPCEDCILEMYSQHAPDCELVKPEDLVDGEDYTIYSSRGDFLTNITFKELKGDYITFGIGLLMFDVHRSSVDEIVEGVQEDW